MCRIPSFLSIWAALGAIDTRFLIPVDAFERHSATTWLAPHRERGIEGENTATLPIFTYSDLTGSSYLYKLFPEAINQPI